MMSSLVAVSTILATASGALSLTTGILLILAPIPIYFILLKVFKVWGKKIYDFKAKPVDKAFSDETERDEVI